METEEIDWKVRFERKVSESIEHDAKVSRKLLEKSNELVAAKNEIALLKHQLNAAKDAPARLAAMQNQLQESDKYWRERVEEEKALHLKYKNALARGQRGVLNDTIRELVARRDRLPALSTQSQIDDARTFLEAVEQ